VVYVIGLGQNPIASGGSCSHPKGAHVQNQTTEERIPIVISFGRYGRFMSVSYIKLR